MKAISAAKSAKSNGGVAAPSSAQRANQQVECADPMLQGTYVSQDEIGRGAQDLDDFENRLAFGPVSNTSSGGLKKKPTPSTASKAAGGPTPSVIPGQVPKRQQALAPAPPKPRTDANSAIQSTSAGSQPKAAPLTEEEEELRQDVADVKRLGESDSSDDDE